MMSGGGPRCGAPLRKRGDPALCVDRVEVVGNGLQQRVEAGFAGLGAFSQALADAQVALHGPERGQRQQCHQQAADQRQPLAVSCRLRHGLVGSGQTSALVLFDGIEHAAQAIHQLLAARTLQPLDGDGQALAAARLDVLRGDLQPCGDGRVEGVEPVPAGVFAPTQLFEQCASPPFQLFEAAFVGFEVARVGGQHEAARAGLDVLQRRQHGLDRGDDFQAVADRAIGFKQRFLGALALPAEGDEQDRREQKRQPMPSFRGACRQTRTPLAGIYTSL